MVSLRLHLDDANERNGALIVLPGSHQFGKLNSRKIEELKRKITPEVCGVSRGGVMLMRPLLVHASSVATTPTHRRVLHFEYAVGELDNGLEWDEEI
jgi:ectoine hydroxylase-related dioxygenase (phytanoyl-CoA dioxygenase family)